MTATAECARLGIEAPSQSLHKLFRVDSGKYQLISGAVISIFSGSKMFSKNAKAKLDSLQPVRISFATQSSGSHSAICIRLETGLSQGPSREKGPFSRPGRRGLPRTGYLQIAALLRRAYSRGVANMANADRIPRLIKFSEFRRPAFSVLRTEKPKSIGDISQREGRVQALGGA